MLINRSIVLVSNDVVAAAMLSAHWGRSNRYFTVLESPRMDRPDADIEVIKALNVIQRIRPRAVLYVGDDARVVEALDAELPIPVLNFTQLSELRRFGVGVDAWESLTPNDAIQKLCTTHLKSDTSEKCIVYNGKTDIGYVVAVNYAILHGATLVKVETPDELLQETIDDLNKIDADLPEVRAIDIRVLQEKLLTFLPQSLIDTDFSRVLIVTEGIPFGLCLENRNVLYANNLMLGYFFAHNIYEYEWGQSERIGLIGLFVADRTVEVEGEYDSFVASLSKAKGLPKRLMTSHPKHAELEIMTLPYDVLYIATHGKQLVGAEEEYVFTSEDGSDHSIIIDRAHGLIGFVAYVKSVDGVQSKSDEWTTSHAKLWVEFMTAHMRNDKPLPDPVSSREGILLPMRALVLGNEPGMNSPFAVQRLASAQRPIVIANACGSWNEMSMHFTFAGAAAYIGTLWAVGSEVAGLFAEKLHENIFEETLDVAFFEARNSLREKIDQLNYVMTGSFENKYDGKAPFTSDGFEEVKRRLNRNLTLTRERIKSFDDTTPKDIRNNTEIDEMMYKEELDALEEAEKQARGMSD